MSESTQSLDDIFNGVEETEVANDVPAEVAEETEVAEESEDTTAEQQEPEKEPEPEAPAASKESDNESWTKAAVLDERRKRQALEAELAELKQPKKEPEKIPDVIDDQSGYTQYVSNKVNEEIANARISMSQEFMRMQDAEYDQKESEFIEMAKENPQLARQLSQHAMPAKFVVETVNKAREFKKLENIDEYKSQLRAEIEAQLREEMKVEISKEVEKSEKVSKIKPSLANARASKSQAEVAENLSLDDLFNN